MAKRKGTEFQNHTSTMASRQQPERQHQRFSWQNPPADISQVEAALSHQQRQQHQYQWSQQSQQIQQSQQSASPPDPSANSHNRGLSYAQTPIEYRRAPFHVPHSPHVPINPLPQSNHNPHNGPAQPPPSYLSASYPHEKEPPSPLSPLIGGTRPPLSPVSPLIDPPQVHTQPPRQHARQLSNLSPINTNVGQFNMPPIPPTPNSYQTDATTLPSKTPITPISPEPKKDPADFQPHPSNRKSYAAEPYSPHGFSSNTRHAVFSPDSAHGPNGLDFALHQPGQITHPNMDLSANGSSHEWKHSLCECSDVSTCLTGLFCPCILYGRTSYRLSQRSAKKDPTEMLSYKTANGHCMVMGVACGFWWLFPMLQRTRLRHMYKLTGSFGGDLLKGCCCCCCVAIQNEREIKDREESSRRWAGPASADVYKSPAQMVYKPQQ